MARLDKGYNPANDSSAGLETPGRVVLWMAEGRCNCGCGVYPSSLNSKFLMGHDARLRGILIRAAIAEVPVVIVTEAGREEYDAAVVASAFQWVTQLDRALARVRPEPG